MNHAALPPSYVFNDAPAGALDPFADGMNPGSSKRRRNDDHLTEADYVSSGANGQWDQHSPLASFAGSKDQTLVPSGDANGQWQQEARSSPYPDVSSYAYQPYFFQQTDPSTYNSQWPPLSLGSFATPTHATIPTSAQTPIPYFPSQQSVGELDSLVSQQLPHQADVVSQRHYAAVGHLHDGSVVASPVVSIDDAGIQVKMQSLSILENLALQLIQNIATASFAQIQENMRRSDSEDSQAFATLKSLFDQTRKVYSRELPFIDAIAIQMFQPDQQEIIRKANAATFISSILGTHDVSFPVLNDFFLETFVPLGHRLLKWQGAVLLELKTQTYISALLNSNVDRDSILNEIFPSELDAQILSRHPDAPSLSPSEQDFIDRSHARRNYLLVDAAGELKRKYDWSDFVREFASCVSKNADSIMNIPARALPVFTSGAVDRRGLPLVHATPDSLTANIGSALAVAPRHLTFQGQTGPNSTPNTTTRDAANSSGPRKPTSASTIRQPWTKAEEDALLDGLGRVHGPHWSQILAVYGRGGSVSEVLKDRNQVQLKDKARNLKLWYLKTGRDVPPALKGVTGELRKRGGARARAALGLLEGADEEGGGGAGAGELGDVNGDALGEGPDAGKKERRKEVKRGG